MKEQQRRSFRFPWWQPRSVAWWVYLALTGGGFALFATLLAPAIVRYPETALAGLSLSAPLVAFWWWFIRRPQIFGRIASRASVAALLWGAGAAVGPFALLGNESIIVAVGQHLGVDVAAAWGPAIAAPLTEEVGKTLGIVVVVLLARARMRTPMEGLMLGAYVGLGFMLAENFLYGFNATTINFGEYPLVATLIVYFARSLLLALLSHMVLTALAGAGLAYLWRHGHRARPVLGTTLIAASVVAHALWNSPLLENFALRMLVSVALVAGFWLVLKQVRRDEQRWLRDTLAPEVARGTVAQPYVDGVARSLRLRRKHRRDVGRAYGYAAEKYQAYLDGLLVDLADAVSVGDEATAALYREAIARSGRSSAAITSAT